jgi:hypothetical protein
MIEADDVLAIVVSQAHIRAIQPVAKLAEKLQASVEAIEPPISILVSDGILDRWPEWEKGPAVLLSGFTARAHRLRLSDAWPPRWVGIGHQERPERKPPWSWISLATDLAPGVGGEGSETNVLELVADAKALSPMALLMRSEADEIRFAREQGQKLPRSLSHPPRPAVLLGLTAVPPDWRGEGCPHCGPWRASGRSLPAFCLRCEFYSHAHLIPLHIKRQVEASVRKAERRVEGSSRPLKGGLGNLRSA